MEAYIRFFVNKMCVGNGDATSRFNNYRSGKLLQQVHIYCDSNKNKINLCSCWLFYTFGSIYVVLQNYFTGTRVSEYFKFRVSGSQNNRKRTALVVRNAL